MKIVETLIICLVALLSTSSVVSPVQALSSDEWRKQSIYSLMTDRFAPSKPVPKCNAADRTYCGGDWRGIIEHLDYIQELGFTAIWISPVIEQIDGVTQYGEAYHGYWPKNLYRLNPHFGTEADLKELSNALHERGMYLMVDVVVNHMGARSLESLDYSEYTPFNHEKYYHNFCPIDEDVPESFDKCWIHTDDFVLPDLNTDLLFVRQTLLEYIKSFVEAFSIDGLRIDATKHIRKDFWPEFCSAAGVFCMGEMWSGEPIKLCDWQNYMDGLQNFPLQTAAGRAFFPSNWEGIIQLADTLTAIRGLCKDPLLLGNFIESHDLPRMASLTKDPAVIKNSIVFNLLGDGIPIMYYGQELAMRGHSDPHNRAALWETGFPKRNPYYFFTLLVNRFRNAVLASPDGEDFIRSQSELSIVDDHVLLLKRGKVITVLNNLGSYYIRFHFTVPAIEHTWINILTCQSAIHEDNRQVFIIRNGDPMILFPQEDAYKLGICPSPALPPEDIPYTPGSESPSSSPVSPVAPVSSHASTQQQNINSVFVALIIVFFMIF
ncbi:alpha-amylase Aah4 [Schizosaccharomyces japonicus yFS275]|uniref:Alpha-amylase Aah4 n=1 Tax=Schizosaccharomyces japonicus (strain yFS275 / FY16936) TaxID=402676 RepID=B6K7S3_SCHJY|nr:alpha-amylase Aah4 [Schizosaccharomyces japonicus yFS275]EEB09577.1 alpha-amylase Aah4 [Schizosaccharomyces japonicus yFS275]